MLAVAVTEQVVCCSVPRVVGLVQVGCVLQCSKSCGLVRVGCALQCSKSCEAGTSVLCVAVFQELWGWYECVVGCSVPRVVGLVRVCCVLQFSKSCGLVRVGCVL